MIRFNSESKLNLLPVAFHNTGSPNSCIASAYKQYLSRWRNLNHGPISARERSIVPNSLLVVAVEAEAAARIRALVVVVMVVVELMLSDASVAVLSATVGITVVPTLSILVVKFMLEILQRT